MSVYDNIEEVENIGYGWKCPDCGRIYSPYTYQCYSCNSSVEEDNEEFE